MLSSLINSLFDFIIFVIFVDILVSWIPNIDRYKQPFLFVHNFAEIFLSPMRRIIPPLGGLDFSPIFVFILLQMTAAFIQKLLLSFGL